MQLAGKVCLVAGASGTIGRAVAERFYQEGASVASTSYSTIPGNFPDELCNGNQRTLCFVLDVRQWDEVQKVVRNVEKELGRIDVLANCIGELGPIGPTHAVSVEQWTHTIEANLIGCFYLARAVLPGMLARNTGKILHFSGGGAAYPRPYFTAYSASKAAVVRFTESLAEELQGTGIQANAIAPGPVKSRMWDQMRAAGTVGGPCLLAELKKMDETGGISVERVAALALFLASERSGKLSGRLISTVYDNWENLEQRISEIMPSEAGTLRRIPLG
jgi:3-oxoacyl-[acyl-carrier protein] reductase